MLQEIAPRHLDNQYHPQAIGPGAKICAFREKSILVSLREDEVLLPEALYVIAWVLLRLTR